MPEDPIVPNEILVESNDASLEFLEGLQQQEADTSAAKQEYLATEEQATAEQQDPREADKW